jgi:hypothetical protein
MMVNNFTNINKAKKLIETHQITMNENIYVYICIAVEEPIIKKGVMIPLSVLIPRHLYDAYNT